MSKCRLGGSSEFAGGISNKGVGRPPIGRFKDRGTKGEGKSKSLPPGRLLCLSREYSNSNRFSASCFYQYCRKSLENTNGYSLRDFLCLEISRRLKTAKHLSARCF